jgi:hypothetical protein
MISKSARKPLCGKQLKTILSRSTQGALSADVAPRSSFSVLQYQFDTLYPRVCRLVRALRCLLLHASSVVSHSPHVDDPGTSLCTVLVNVSLYCYICGTRLRSCTHRNTRAARKNTEAVVSKASSHRAGFARWFKTCSQWRSTGPRRVCHTGTGYF